MPVQLLRWFRRSRRFLSVEILERRDLLTALRVVNYNTLDGPNNNATEISRFTTIFEAISNQSVGGLARAIDLIALQETSPQRANNIEAILESISGDVYESITIGSGPEEYVGFAYNMDVLELLATSSVTGSFTHEPLRAKFRPIGTSGDADFYAYSIHLKAGNTASDQATRSVETAALRNNANSLGEGANVMFLGDFNMRSSNEAAFSSFVAAGNARLFDPINRLGNWHNNSSFRNVHTQNPQADINGGGMDDRFDLQLLSGEFFDGQGIDYTSGSYRAFGNNGTHNLNGPITSGTGASLSVLSALALASDHLPVVADYEFTVGVSLTVDDIVVDESAGIATFTITADSAPASAVTVQYATQSGTAIANLDFQPISGTATILPTETSTTVVVNIIDDVDEELDETFFLNLFSPSVGATIQDSQGTATILANDAVTVTFGFAQDLVTVTQGTSLVNIELILSGNASSFDAFTYAIGIGDGFGGGGVGTPPSFVAVPVLINDVSTWANVASLPTPQAATGNVNAPAGSGQDATIPSAVLSIAIDVSQSLAGDAWTIDANLVNASEASLRGTPFSTRSADLTINVIASGSVVDRHLFYDNTFFDGFDAGPSPLDDAAIDDSKIPLMPGDAAGFQHYSGFEQGINGIMIDIDGLSQPPTVSDFAFAVGNDWDPESWIALSVAPEIDVRMGAGTDGSDRVTLTWPAGTIVNQWLEVKVLSDGPGVIVANTDTFYFGNALGEVGVGDTRVNSTDAGSIRSNFTPIFPPQTELVSEPNDVNKDGRVNSTDVGFVSANFTPVFPPGQELKLITPAQGGVSAGVVSAFFIEPSLSDASKADNMATYLVDTFMAKLGRRQAASFERFGRIALPGKVPPIFGPKLTKLQETDSAVRLVETIENDRWVIKLKDIERHATDSTRRFLLATYEP